MRTVRDDAQRVSARRATWSSQWHTMVGLATTLPGAHRVVTDQPIEDGGQDAGMSSVELFVGSLASCVGYFVGRYCDRHQISTKGLSVEAEWTMAEQPHRVGQVTLAIHLPHRVTAEQSERLLKVAQGCAVHQSITVPAGVAIELNPHHHGEQQS